MPNLTSRLTVELIDKLTGPAKGAAGALKGIGDATKKLEQIDAFKNMRRGLAEAHKAYDVAKQKATQLAAALQGVEKVTRTQQAALARANAAVERSKAAWLAQGQAVRQATSGLQSAGIAINGLAAAEGKLRASIAQTNAAMAQQGANAAKWAKRRQAAGLVGSAMAGSAAARFPQWMKDSVTQLKEFDYATRQQRAFMDLTKDMQGPLQAQALKIAKDTVYSNVDVVHAQTAAMQGLGAKPSPAEKARAALNITEQSSYLAQMMPGTDLTTASELVRSYMTSFGQNPMDTTSARNAVNVLAKSAKIGGMSMEDLAQLVKFGAPSAQSAGLSPETTMSIGAIARMVGLRGDEAGTFIKATATKLHKPTKGGMAALNAAGIRFEDYVGAPGSISMDGLNAHTQRSLGISLSKRAKEALTKAFADPEVRKDQGRFTEAYVNALAGDLPKNKKGVVGQIQRDKAARAAGQFHRVARGTVATEGLLDAILKSNMSYAQASEFFTTAHGGKAQLTAAQWEQIQASRQKLTDVQTSDPDFGKRTAADIQAGVAGALNQLTGSIETAKLKTAEAFDGLIKTSAEKIGAVLDAFSESSEGVRRFTTAIVAATAGAATLAATYGILGLLRGGAAAVPAAAGGAAAAAGTVAATAGGAAAGAAAGAGSGVGLMARLAAGGVALLQGGVIAGVVAAAVDLAERNRQARAEGRTPGAALAAGNRARLLKGRSPEEMVGNPSVDVTVNTSSLDAAKEKAGTTKEAVAEVGTPVAVQVDAAQLERVLSLARQAQSAITGLGAQLAGVGASARRTFADVGVSP